MAQNQKSIGIVGIGISLPQKVLTNFDLEKIVDTSDEWIRTRTGIFERRIADENTSSSCLGAEAAKKALEHANISPEEIDLIIVATATPDMFFPSTACIIQSKIGAKNAAAFDISAACSGFVYGITVANKFIATGQYKNALVIGTETLSQITDWKDRNTCILFGDGAGAVILKEVEEGYGILATRLGADGSLGEYLTAPACFASKEEVEKRAEGKIHTIWMNGREVFKFAVRIFEETTKQVLGDCNLGIKDVDLFIPHQANIRIINSAAEKLGIPSEKFFSNIHKYGNISAASIPVALYEAYSEGKIKKGDVILLVAFGGGLTWGSVVIKWNL